MLCFCCLSHISPIIQLANNDRGPCARELPLNYNIAPIVLVLAKHSILSFVLALHSLCSVQFVRMLCALHWLARFGAVTGSRLEELNVLHFQLMVARPRLVIRVDVRHQRVPRAIDALAYNATVLLLALGVLVGNVSLQRGFRAQHLTT